MCYNTEKETCFGEGSRIDAQKNGANGEAKLAVLQAFSEHDGMESYLKKKSIQKDMTKFPEEKHDEKNLLVTRREIPNAVPVQNETLSATRRQMPEIIAHAVPNNDTPDSSKANEISQLLIQQYRTSQLPPRENLCLKVIL